jgi:hypothetical protein
MQSGPSLLRAITGVRLERDALEMLARLVPAQCDEPRMGATTVVRGGGGV